MLILRLLSKLPLSVLYVFASFLYVVVYYLVGYRKKVVFDNLQKSFPEKSVREIKAIQKRFYKNLADVIVEILKTNSISEKEMAKRVVIKNPEVIEEIVAGEEQSILGLTGHICNWEWILQGSCIHLGFPVDAVYKKLSSKKFDKFMFRLRSTFGGAPVEMNNFAREIIRRKRTARAYALIADQSPKKEHIKLWVPFLNRKTGFYEGPATIAGMMKMPVLYVGMKRVKKGYYEVFFEVLATPPYEKKELHKIIEKYAQRLEEQIKASPADWLWSHRRWKHSPE